MPENSSISIRAATGLDAASIQAIYAPYVVATVISFEETAPGVDEIKDRIEAISLSYPYLVAVENGKVIGFCYASQHRARAAYRRSVDVTAYVDDQSQGRGVGKAIYQELLRQLAERGFHAAFAGIALPNDKSVALHEAMGFELVGVYREVGFKLGKWHDVGWWQRCLS